MFDKCSDNVSKSEFETEDRYWQRKYQEHNIHPLAVLLITVVFNGDNNENSKMEDLGEHFVVKKPNKGVNVLYMTEKICIDKLMATISHCIH